MTRFSQGSIDWGFNFRSSICSHCWWHFYIFFLHSLSTYSFDWEDISLSRQWLGHFQTSRIFLILLCDWYFQLSFQRWKCGKILSPVLDLLLEWVTLKWSKEDVVIACHTTQVQAKHINWKINSGSMNNILCSSVQVNSICSTARPHILFHLLIIVVLHLYSAN